MAPKQRGAKTNSKLASTTSVQGSAGSAQKGWRSCSQCQKVDESLLQCGRCKAVYYCSLPCQKKHWQDHKLTCRASTPSGMNQKQCAASTSQAPVEDGLLRQEPRSIVFSKSVMDGQVRVMTPKASMQAFGVNTCAFIMVETKKSFIGWHASAWNMPGNPLAKDMAEVHQALRQVREEQFVRGFVTPGSALTRNLHWQGTDAFAVFVDHSMAEYEWWSGMATTCPLPYFNDVIEFSPDHALPVVFSSLSSLSKTHPMQCGPAGTNSLPKHPPAVLQDKHGKLGLFANASASQGDIVLELDALVFHEIPVEKRCEGCMQGRSTKCVGCDARFCSSTCCQFTTALWHGAACGNAAVRRAQHFCEGRLCINDIKLNQPWRAGMGGFKMLLSLVMAARSGVGSLRNLMSKYRQISSFARVFEGSDGGAQLVELSKIKFMESGGANVLWTCWEEVLEKEEIEIQRLLKEEAPIDFDIFLEIIVKYNSQNQQGGLYYEVSFCAHSCRPNVAIKPLDMGGPLRLFALRKINPGEQLTMTFVNPQLDLPQRRMQLKSQYAIECSCDRCINDIGIPQDELALLLGGGSGDGCLLM